MIRRIAVLTGDDDAPGMNAVIRAVTRTALDNGWEVMGVCDGFAGLIAGEFIALTARSVEGIMQRGGTMLDSFDSKQFLTEAGAALALYNLAEHDIDALVVIGGDESQAGAYALSQRGFQVNGVAASVENDLAGFDMTPGVDTALNIALDTIDRLKLTRASGCDALMVEVAGRKCGYLALVSAIASGAEAVVIPEIETTPEQIEDAIKDFHERGIDHPVIVVAEGAAYNANRLHRHFGKDDPLGQKMQETRLAYLQRRAAPSAFDRMLGTRLGASAVDALARGEYGIMAGSLHEQMRTMPLAEVVGKAKLIDPDLLRLANVLPVKISAPSTEEVRAKP